MNNKNSNNNNNNNNNNGNEDNKTKTERTIIKKKISFCDRNSPQLITRYRNSIYQRYNLIMKNDTW